MVSSDPPWPSCSAESFGYWVFRSCCRSTFGRNFARWVGSTILPTRLFDLLDFTVANILIPVSGLLLALFTGWAMRSESMRDELGMSDGGLFTVWRILVRYVAPIAIAAVLISSVSG